ncbi:MAG: DsbA family protein [Planctomycetaceae bacterium]
MGIVPATKISHDTNHSPNQPTCSRVTGICRLLILTFLHPAGHKRTLSRTREAEGIHFAFDKLERTPNTVDAHRLIWLADQHGCQDAVVEALFRAYFNEGRNISNCQSLTDVVSVAGLDQNAAEAMLNSDEGMDVIEEGQKLSLRHQVTGVPFFIINKAITLSGAQEPDTFLDAFKQTIDRQ